MCEPPEDWKAPGAGGSPEDDDAIDSDEILEWDEGDDPGVWELLVTLVAVLFLWILMPRRR